MLLEELEENDNITMECDGYVSDLIVQRFGRKSEPSKKDWGVIVEVMWCGMSSQSILIDMPFRLFAYLL